MTESLFPLTHKDQLTILRIELRKAYIADEQVCMDALLKSLDLSLDKRTQMSVQAASLVRHVRNHSSPTMMEKFLGEYGLSTKEGVALMCMAEALLRVPDKATIDALIEDKVQAGDWSSHLGHSNSSLINSSTWALLVTGKLIAPVDVEKVGSAMRSLVKRVGEPLVRKAVAQAMKELGVSVCIRPHHERSHPAGQKADGSRLHSFLRYVG